LVGFNYSKVPSVFVEMGLMSNAAEDRKLATAAYQDKLAVGMANGIVAYLNGK
jgi:N-acetylmuramoyl-L-alanine amidase